MGSTFDITTVTTQQEMDQMDVSSITPDKLPGCAYQAIAQAAKNHPEKTAIRYILDGDCTAKNKIPFTKKLIHKIIKVTKGKTFAKPYREISFGQVAHRVTQMANALTNLGVERNDVASIILPNFPEMYFSLWGAETAGIANPINPMLDSTIIKEIVTTANSKVLIALGPVPGSDIWQKTLAIKDQIPSLEAVICLFGDDIPAKADGEVPVYNFEKLLAEQSSIELQCPLPQQSDVCSYFHTGGTTGLPKLAKHTHLNELTNAAQVNLMLPLTQDDTILIGLPIFHVNAAITGIASIMLGSTVLLTGPSGFRGKNVVRNLLTLLENYQVAFMIAVPTVYAGLLEQIANNQVELVRPSNIKFAICGAAPLSPELQARFMDQTGIALIEGYGSTEGTAVSTLMPLHAIAKQTSVGLTIPGMTVVIGDIDNDGNLIRLCDVDEAGEILIAGNNVFPGYVDDSHNQSIWVTSPDGQQLMRTGDLGKQDQLGYLSLCGREKELIIRGGHNIDPKMIEDAATSHPDIFLAAAVPSPDSYAGEIPVLYVTTKADTTVTPEQLLEFMNEHVPERAAVPKRIDIIDEMPLTAVGKLYKPELACREITLVIKQSLSNIPQAQHASIVTIPDKKRGNAATISIAGSAGEQVTIETEIKERLAMFSFNYQIAYQVSDKQEA